MEALRAELLAAAGQGLAVRELGELISAVLRVWLPHDGLRLRAAAPASGEAGLELGSFGFCHGYPTALAEEHRPPPREVLVWTAPGFCEARAPLRDGGGTWGELGVLRAWPFSPVELRWLAGLGALLPEVLRAYVRTGPLVAATPAPAAGVLLLDAEHRVRALTGHARSWWEWQGAAFFGGMSWLARRRPGGARVHGPAVSHGRWVLFDGQRLGPGEVAVSVRAASGAELLPVFCDWYGITARERQVLADVYDGALPKQVARRRGLSVHTVNDHLKSLLRKTGAGGRGELVRALAG